MLPDNTPNFQRDKIMLAPPDDKFTIKATQFFPVQNDESLLVDSKAMRCVGGRMREGDIILMSTPVKKRVALSFQGEDRRIAVGFIWQITKECEKYEEEHRSAAGNEKPGFTILNRTPIPADTVIMGLLASAADPMIPKTYRKVEFLLFEEPGTEPQVFIGVTGTNFSPIGPGPDAPVDTSSDGAVFAVVNLSLCPKELQEALKAH